VLLGAVLTYKLCVVAVLTNTPDSDAAGQCCEDSSVQCACATRWWCSEGGPGGVSFGPVQSQGAWCVALVGTGLPEWVQVALKGVPGIQATLTMWAVLVLQHTKTAQGRIGCQ
jgi:hypothetical protein